MHAFIVPVMYVICSESFQGIMHVPNYVLMESKLKSEEGKTLFS